MSDVTGVILCTSSLESPSDDDPHGPCWAAVQAWLVARGFEPLAYVDIAFGGTKHPQMIVGGCGFNHFWIHRDEFSDFVGDLPWVELCNVLLTMQPEEGWTTLHRYSSGRRSAAVWRSV